MLRTATKPLEKQIPGICFYVQEWLTFISGVFFGPHYLCPTSMIFFDNQSTRLSYHIHKDVRLWDNKPSVCLARRVGRAGRYSVTIHVAAREFSGPIREGVKYFPVPIDSNSM